MRIGFLGKYSVSAEIEKSSPKDSATKINWKPRRPLSSPLSCRPNGPRNETSAVAKLHRSPSTTESSNFSNTSVCCTAQTRSNVMQGSFFTPHPPLAPMRIVYHGDRPDSLETEERYQQLVQNIEKIDDDYFTAAVQAAGECGFSASRIISQNKRRNHVNLVRLLLRDLINNLPLVLFSRQPSPKRSMSPTQVPKSQEKPHHNVTLRKSEISGPDTGSTSKQNPVSNSRSPEKRRPGSKPSSPEKRATDKAVSDLISKSPEKNATSNSVFGAKEERTTESKSHPIDKKTPKIHSNQAKKNAPETNSYPAKKKDSGSKLHPKEMSVPETDLEKITHAAVQTIEDRPAPDRASGDTDTEEWVGGVRALRDSHVRLVVRQLRHIDRLNRALDRATKSGTKATRQPL